MVTLGFGLSVLTFNFAMEYAALDGETPLTELPSFQSMLKRTGADSEFNADIVAARFRRPFLEEQFSRISRMFIPYALLGGSDAPESPTWLSERAVIVLGVALSVAGLIGSIFARPRILFATLASFGFFWALLVRNSNAAHGFESIYYIGVPLVFFTIALLLARRLTSRDAVFAAAATAALLLFAASSFQMSRTGHSAEASQSSRAVEQDLRTIRELTAGEPVIVLGIRGFRRSLPHASDTALHYYLRLAMVANEYPLPASSKYIVTYHRVDSDALLTPQNQYLFLYDAPSLTASFLASYRSAYPSLVSTEPLAREDFDVYLDDNTVYYLKEPCECEDTKAIIFLHVFPTNPEDLPYHRGEHGFDNLDFDFIERGVMFDDKCMAIVDLPHYGIAGFRTGSYEDGQVWIAPHVTQGPKLISEYQSIVSNEPAARAEFDVYLDGDNLYYVKEPCGVKDTQALFFLHVVPEDLNDLPDHRRRHGFDNLDFGFDVRGVAFDGKCAAAAPLPKYDIVRITTGQFDGVDRIWEVEFAPEAIE